MKYSTAAEAEKILDELRSELERRKSSAVSLQALRKRIDDEVRKLTDAARSGDLRNPRDLTDALRRQAEIQTMEEGNVSEIQAQIQTLENDLYKLKLNDAKEEYRQAVLAYARACAPLPALALRVRELAPAAQMLLSDYNSPHLLGRSITIGGAVLDI